jgi:hypothetical protein
MDGPRTLHHRVQAARVRGRAGAAGIAIGALAGILTILAAGTALAHTFAPAVGAPVLEATHLPPLLTAAGEQVELRYDVFCAAAGDDAPGPCAAKGSVFVRTGNAGAFRELALHERRSASDGRFAALVPPAIAQAAAGFSYYAVLRTPGGTITLPDGGAAAPQRSLPLGSPIHVALGAHLFGRTARASTRVAEAAWGSGPGQVGLEQGRNLTPIGGASFDVSADGTVHVLDEANGRVLRWRGGSRAASAAVPLAINRTLADLSVAPDGTMHVLETTNGGRDMQLLRSFSASGARQNVATIDGRASQVRLSPEGVPLVLQQPSSQWMPAADAAGRALAPAAQQVEAKTARPVARGNEVVLLTRGEEIRVALRGPGGTQRSWRITSGTPLAEVQLADVAGSRLVVVARVYTDAKDEFVALVLGPGGLERSVSLDSADWAETAPLSRFRLRGLSLYQLGSTPAGVFVDRFDLEVK